SNTMHKFSTGISFTYDQYDELVSTTDWSRTDNSVGAFFEYTYCNDDDFSVVAGLRVDNHNRLGTFVILRIHSRSESWEGGTFKASVGRGIRSTYIFVDDQYLFASSRTFDIFYTNRKFYGLVAEVAWNYGVSFMQDFLICGKKNEV